MKRWKHNQCASNFNNNVSFLDSQKGNWLLLLLLGLFVCFIFLTFLFSLNSWRWRTYKVKVIQMRHKHADHNVGHSEVIKELSLQQGRWARDKGTFHTSPTTRVQSPEPVRTKPDALACVWNLSRRKVRWQTNRRISPKLPRGELSVCQTETSKEDLVRAKRKVRTSWELSSDLHIRAVAPELTRAHTHMLTHTSVFFK